ncbi:MAG: glycosyltransferase family 2 protein [Alphaproteobacteria bacterium]|nr:glycosyltransferase family 2 protein [Alphaproteobacteria bacterium]
MKRLSFVIPCYNEEACVDALYAALDKLSKEIAARYECEFILVENGSHDTTFKRLLARREADNRVKIVKLSRNFMADGGITAGLAYAAGDAAVIMCADLEDPPEVVHEFLAKWEEGYQNIYGIIRRRQGNWLRRLNSRLFYLIINKMTGGVIPRAVSDFRLIDRVVIDAVNRMNERTRMWRGLVAWTGFKSCGVPFNRGNRAAGESKASTALVLKLALRGIFAFSVLPLRMATIVGTALSAGSFAALVYQVVKVLIFGVPFDGFCTLICAVYLLYGFLYIILGIMSEYIGMIYE